MWANFALFLVVLTKQNIFHIAMPWSDFRLTVLGFVNYSKLREFKLMLFFQYYFLSSTESWLRKLTWIGMSILGIARFYFKQCIILYISSYNKE